MKELKIGRRAYRLPTAAFIAGFSIFLGSCSNENGQNSLSPKGPAAQTINNLFIPVLIVAILIGIAIIAATFYVALRFRHREGRLDNPKQIHGNSMLEIGWTIVPALILAVIAVPTVSTIFALAERPTGPDVLVVDASGKQWWWQFELGKQPMVPSNIVTSTELHIPVNTKVLVRLHSDNAIHSFWIPELAGKKDVMPARTNEVVLEASAPGTFLGACAEYCGLSHADMRMRVIASSMADWEAWRDDQIGGPAQAYTGEVAQLTGATYGCTNCHIFDKSTKTNYGPNLTHLASRTTFAGGTYELNRENLTRWVMNAPSMIAMQAKKCRLPPPATCVGMPSFIKNTPKGQPVMTQSDADAIVSYLLGET